MNRKAITWNPIEGPFIDDDNDELTSDEWGYIGCNSISIFNPYNNAICVCDNV
jgi:hypothetical protein